MNPERNYIEDLPLKLEEVITQLQKIKDNMTNLNLQTLTAIDDIQRNTGFVPSMRDLRVHFGVSSTNTVSARISQLEELGLIVRIPREHKMAITLIGKLVLNLSKDQQ